MVQKNFKGLFILFMGLLVFSGWTIMAESNEDEAVRQKLLEILKIDTAELEEIKRMYGFTEKELLENQLNKPPRAIIGQEVLRREHKLGIDKLRKVPPHQRDRAWEEELIKRRNQLRMEMNQWINKQMSNNPQFREQLLKYMNPSPEVPQ